MYIQRQKTADDPLEQKLQDLQRAHEEYELLLEALEAGASDVGSKEAVQAAKEMLEADLKTRAQALTLDDFHEALSREMIDAQELQALMLAQKKGLSLGREQDLGLER